MEIDDAVHALTEFILEASSQCIPKRSIHVNGKDKPWVRKAPKIEIRKRNKLFRIAKATNSEDDWGHWKKQRNLATLMNCNLKNKYIIHKVERLLENKQNTRKYHQILKGLMGRERILTMPPLIDANNKLYEDNIDKANLLNDFFARQSNDTLSKQNILPSLPDREIPNLQDITITEDEVFNPRPAGPLDFPRPAGGGVFEHPPRLSRLLRIVEQNGKRRSKAREKSFRNHFGHFFCSGQN